MPKERKQRGRRKKRQDEAEQKDDAEVSPIGDESAGQRGSAGENYEGQGDDGDFSASFFGLLDESEQTYFKTIDDAMVADEFSGPEERDVFVENVFKEAEGKELKLATSPLGSKVLEQLLARSKPEQVRHLFKQYQSNFYTLVKHRYASHVCEMLFAISSTIVTTEMARVQQSENEADDEPYVSMENLFLYMLNEITAEIPSLGADVYASHVVRDVLLILQGTLFTFEEAKGQAKRYHGQKKFSWARPDRDLPVPSSFKDALQGVMQSLSTMPSPQLRMTASQPYSVSFIQVLLATESAYPTTLGRPILFNVLGGETLHERDDYMESILREPSGSKLFESIIAAVPETHFSRFYECYFKDRAAKFAHNPITNFVLQKLIVTCKDPQVITHIKEELSPVLRDLIDLNHMQVIQKLIEACIVTKTSSVDLFNDIATAFHCGQGCDQLQLVPQILETPVAASMEETNRPPRRQEADAGKIYNMQGVFLIKAMMQLPDECYAIVANSIVSSPPETLLSYAKSHAALKVLEAFFLSERTSLLHRKRALNGFFGHFVEMANDATASRFVDLCWHATAQIKLYKERIAQELIAVADDVRGNYYGRIVWRNWNMDLYKNKRGEWNYLVKQSLAKDAALAKLKQSQQVAAAGDHGGEPSVVTEGAAHVDATSSRTHADRASMIQDEFTKKERKGRKKRKEVVEDEVDDIFKRRRV